MDSHVVEKVDEQNNPCNLKVKNLLVNNFCTSNEVKKLYHISGKIQTHHVRIDSNRIENVGLRH